MRDLVVVVKLRAEHLLGSVVKLEFKKMVLLTTSLWGALLRQLTILAIVIDTVKVHLLLLLLLIKCSFELWLIFQTVFSQQQRETSTLARHSLLCLNGLQTHMNGIGIGHFGKKISTFSVPCPFASLIWRSFSSFKVFDSHSFLCNPV